MNRPDEEKKVIIKTKGGLGNRMLCAATGILYARATGRTPIVDWRDGVYGEPGVNAFPYFFDCPHISPTPATLGNETVYPPVWRGHLDDTVASMFSQFDPQGHTSKFIHRKYSVDVKNTGYEEKNLVFWNYSDRINRLRPLLSLNPELGYAALDRPAVLRRFFTVDCPLQPDIETEIQNFQQTNWEEKVIGLHVRYTDHKTSLKKYEAPVNNLLRQHPDSVIFLASDNAVVQKWCESKFGKTISTTKWMPPPGVPLHRAQECPDKRRGGVEALVDMHLLSRCNILVFPSNSTFSWFSSIMMNPYVSQIIDVEKWNPKANAAKLLREIIN